MSILIASPIRQDPETLAAHLLTLSLLNKCGHTITYLFIDDNSDPLSSLLLQSFVEVYGGKVVPGNRPKTSFKRTKQGKRWNAELIWHVAKHRCFIMDYAAQNDHDYLFMTDSDLMLQPQTLFYLIEANKDLVSEVFWTKWKDQNKPLPQVWEYGQYHFADPDLPPDEYDKATDVWVKRLLQPGVYQVGGLGACTLFSKKVLQSSLRYHQKEGLTLIGEDRHFCVLAQEMGFSLWADTRAAPMHVFQPELVPQIPVFLDRIYGEDDLRRLYFAANTSQRFFSYDYQQPDASELLELLTRTMQLSYTRRSSYLQSKRVKDKSTSKAYVFGVSQQKASPIQVHTTCLLQDKGKKSNRTFTSLVRLQLEDELLCVADVQPKPLAAVSKPAPQIHVPSNRPRVISSMIVRNEADNCIAEMIAKTKPLVDQFVIVDDASDDQTIDICMAAAGDTPIEIVALKEPLYIKSEAEIRTIQWQKTMSFCPEWVLLLDADEIFEDGIAAVWDDLLSQQCFGRIGFRKYDMWNRTQYRADRYWSAHLRHWPVLVRRHDDFSASYRQAKVHCGRHPLQYDSLPTMKSELRILHWGNATERLREKKYHWYHHIDPEGKFGIPAQVDSLLDTQPNLITFT